MELKEYYSASFQADLDKVFGTQRPLYFGGSWHTERCPELLAVAEEHGPAFVACLYTAVLLDQGLYQHAYDEGYPKTSLCEKNPKFCKGPGNGQLKPREILRYPMHYELVSSEALMPLAAPAAHLFIALCETVEKILPQVSLPNFFLRLPNLPPDVNDWSPRVTRKFAVETKVERKFWEEMLNAIRAWEHRTTGK